MIGVCIFVREGIGVMIKGAAVLHLSLHMRADFSVLRSCIVFLGAFVRLVKTVDGGCRLKAD